MKKSKENLNREMFQVYKLKGFILLRCQFFPTLYIQCNSIQNPNKHFCKYLKRIILKFIWKGKKHRIASTKMKKNEIGRLTLFDFKTYYKTIVIEVV